MGETKLADEWGEKGGDKIVEENYFELRWSGKKQMITCYAHDILNYRYNWHHSEYEIDILLHGKMEFCKGKETYIMEEDDVILVEPQVGHASFAMCEDTCALVIRFSDGIFQTLLKPGESFFFNGCCSNKENRYQPGFQQLRLFAAYMLAAATDRGIYSSMTMKSCMGMIASVLCRMFEPQVRKHPGENDGYEETVKRFIRYLEEHYASKLTLEDLAQFSQYNRTYVSTIFKNAVGINFHEYLTRLRMRHAIFELSTTTKNLTEVAIDNGFSDLKTFNNRFREVFKCTPAEYRARLVPGQVMPLFGRKKLISIQDPRVKAKLKEYGLGLLE